MEVFMLPKLILKQQNHSQLYVAQHIIALYRCYRCCHFITGKIPNHQEINQKMLYHLNFLATIHQLYYYKY